MISYESSDGSITTKSRIILGKLNHKTSLTVTNDSSSLKLTVTGGSDDGSYTIHSGSKTISLVDVTKLEFDSYMGTTNYFTNTTFSLS